jgi:hypothetical protein
MTGGGEIIGIALGTAAGVGLLYSLTRLYIASRENAKKQFLHELTYGDVIAVPFVGRIGEKTGGRELLSGLGEGGYRAANRPSDTLTHAFTRPSLGTEA